ncbi:DUF3945 domain-containing protein [Hymenobacter profundi]|uniref:DUF3945 domain-containing protein n=1 Tax=Hymenobacter profundi TaxID=1982110 RepID=A0ABS6WUB6_9BACT|nr:DUF3945 domain-containing protein [Hymenobacter profundi]MBW3127171.1 DUF3945 domain-containing protein [Hymenobacter profundi]
MAELDDNPTPAPLYLSQLPTANGNIAGDWLQSQQAHHSLFQVQLNPANPNQAALLPAPGADGALMSSYNDTLGSVYQLGKIPGQADRYVRLERPTLLEKIGDNWKVMQQGRVSFSPNAPEPLGALFGKPALAPALQVEPRQPAIESAATRSEQTSAPAQEIPMSKPPEQVSTTQVEATPQTVKPELPVPVGEGQGSNPKAELPPSVTASPAQIGELQIQWRQKGDEVAPLLEMRAYLDQLKEAGVAVGALTLERDPGGKLSGRFDVSYDPASNKLGQLEATLQGYRQVGNGIAVVENPEQAAARRQEAGYDEGYEPPRSRQVKEAFGVKQWDALSAQLSAVPKHSLTAPEQVQQHAASLRVEQVAQLQGKTSDQIIREAKSLFDIDTSGNPASAFLKNFYAHLNGGPKTRQSLEVDYERTRQDLQARLTRQVGAGPLSIAEQLSREPALALNETTPTVAAVGTPVSNNPKANPSLLFEPRDVPQAVLNSLGLKREEMAASGQLHKLLRGEKTDLLPLVVAGREGQEPVRFEGKMVLHREADGSATLKLELPQQKLVIPNEIGGQAFTPEQREKLEKEGNAGLIRGLKDEQGRAYNGYVAVDQKMNKIVVLPEHKVTLHDTVAGVPLSPEQSQDLREGKVVALTNMASSYGGPKFDGTVQVNAAKACLEVKPAAHELQQQLAPRKEQATKATQAVTTSAQAEAPQVKTRGPRL